MERMRRIIMVAVMCCALMSAIAFRKPPPLQWKYGVSALTAKGFIVADRVDDWVEGIDYRCGDMSTLACTVSSDEVYLPGQVIPFAMAQVEVAHKRFTMLFP